MSLDETKSCAVCSAEFLRGRRSIDEWQRRESCSVRCLAELRRSRSSSRSSKTCGKCKRELPISSFAFRKGRTWDAYCKECVVIRSREYYDKNPKRNSAPKPHGWWNSIDPVKKRARSLAQSAIRRGKLKRRPCEKCGAKADAHHEDYSKPLDVRWLCRKHHGLEHRKRLAAEDAIRALATSPRDGES